MKIALIALAAVLAPFCAAQAAPLENPGPHKLPKTQRACQNLLDIDDLDGAFIVKDTRKYAYLWETLGGPENDARQRLCITIPAGTTVTIEKRQSGYECVTVRGRPASACFQTEKFSKTYSRTTTPTYDPGTVIFVD